MLTIYFYSVMYIFLCMFNKIITVFRYTDIPGSGMDNACRDSINSFFKFSCNRQKIHMPTFYFKYHTHFISFWTNNSLQPWAAFSMLPPNWFTAFCVTKLLPIPTCSELLMYYTFQTLTGYIINNQYFRKISGCKWLGTQIHSSPTNTYTHNQQWPNYLFLWPCLPVLY